MHGEDTVDFRNAFSVLEAIGQYSKRKRFRFRDSFIASGTIREDAREVRDFADPPTIVFAFDLYREVTHDEIVQRRFRRREIRQYNGSHAQLRGQFRVPA